MAGCVASCTTDVRTALPPEPYGESGVLRGQHVRRNRPGIPCPYGIVATGYPWASDSENTVGPEAVEFGKKIGTRQASL